MLKGNSRHTQQLSEAHTYVVGLEKRVPKFMYGFLILLVQPIISLVTAVQQQDMRRIWLNVIMLVLFCLLGFIVWRTSVKRQHLIVGREGMIYVAGIYTLYTPWDNIRKVVLSPHSGEPALHLQNPATLLPLEQGIREQRAAIESSFYSKKRPLQIKSRYDQYNYIPLSTIKNDLWQDIQQHLPELDMTVPRI